MGIAEVHNLQKRILEAQKQLVKNDYIKELLTNNKIELDFIWVYELSGGVLTGSARAAIELTAKQKGYTLRTIHPGDIVEQNVDPKRLNVSVDENNKIIKVGLY
jgi:hypothetical protein